jgi:hypothetical protein
MARTAPHDLRTGAHHFETLLQRVALRAALATFARRLHGNLLIGAALFALALIFAKTLALIPATSLPAIGAVLGAAVLGATSLFRRRAANEKIARLVDAHAGSKDLFLTAASLDRATGAFQPIVVAAASERAAELEPRAIVPFRWRSGVRDVAAALLLLVAGVWWLPQWDPWHRQAGREKLAQQKERLQALAGTTTERKAEIVAATKANEERVSQALAELEKTFKAAQPQLKEETLKRLAEHQRDLGALWQNAAKQIPRETFEKPPQQFGASDAKANAIREAVARRDFTEIQKKIAELRKEMSQLASMPDGAEKRALQERLAEQLSTLADAFSKAGTTPELQAALARALQQLDLARRNDLAKEGLAGADASLALSAEEIANLSRLLADADALNAALQNLQMARRLAQLGQLDGQACKDCNCMADYAALYAKLLGNQTGIGPGMGPRPGLGAGGKAPEDESSVTAFRPEKTNTNLTAGKMLLEWKTSEVGESGPRADALRDGIQQLKQGVSEAIVAEQIPPGYHAAIQKYFDSLPAK